MATLSLISNPGSASRKYALFEGSTCLAKLHFEYNDDQIVYSVEVKGHFKGQYQFPVNGLEQIAEHLWHVLLQHGLVTDQDKITRIVFRVVAPSEYFQHDRLLNTDTIKRLEEQNQHAPLHIAATLSEVKRLSIEFPDAKLIGISDSAFHSTKPERAQYYGLPLLDAKKHDLVRFGFHGLSAQAVVETLRHNSKLPKRLVICHLGSGASVTAVHNGTSIDNSMGYSPLDGLVMATRSGSIDPLIVNRLSKEFGFEQSELEAYLNHQSGLLGLSGISGDIRELLKSEKSGNHRAELALMIYVYKVQQMIGQMAAALNGLDMLVFCGTVGVRSAEIRRRIASSLLFLGVHLDPHLNHRQTESVVLNRLSYPHNPVKVYVLDSDETMIMAKRALKFD